MSESVCLQCEHKRYCVTGIHQPQENCAVTGCSCFEQKAKQTNADRIRAMTDEELADELLTAFAAFYDVEWSKEAVLDWLKQEATE